MISAGQPPDESRPGFHLSTMRHAVRAGRTWSGEAHDYDELIWATAGVVRVAAEGASWTISEGSAVWVPRSVRHDIELSAEAILYATFFARDAVRHLPRSAVVVELLPAIRELLLLNRDHVMPTATRRRLQSLVIELLRPAPDVAVDLQLPSSPRLLRVAEQILADLDGTETTKDWADRIGVPARRLAREFAAETGLTLTQWRIRARVRASLVMLASGQPVSVTARRLGYASTSTFIDHFRTVMGTTPVAHFSVSASQPR